MDQGLKERLIGAAVLVALAVWLIPWLLDGPEQPLPSDLDPLTLPVPSGHVGEVRTEVIDLAPPGDGRLLPVAGGMEPSGATRVDGASAGPTGSVPAERGQSDGPAASASSPPATGAASGTEPSLPASASSSTSSNALPSVDTGSSSTASGAASSQPTSTASGAARASAPPSGSSSSSTSSEPPTTRSEPATSARSPEARTAPAPSGNWAVQLGSFGDEENAQRLVRRVSAIGHSPAITTYRANGRVMYRVRIGPYATRDAAQSAASALAAAGFPAQVVTVR